MECPWTWKSLVGSERRIGWQPAASTTVNLTRERCRGEASWRLDLERQRLQRSPCKPGPETAGVVRKAFDELNKSFHAYCKKYAVQEQDFPFAPDAVHRVLDDGSTEERRDNVFLLTLDIIKGTNAEQTNGMKDEIRAVFACFQGKGLVFEDTGNDAFVAVCDDPLTLWDAASAIRVRGETLIIPGRPFGGTRKGLYFGSVAVIRSTNDKILIRDTRSPKHRPGGLLYPGRR